MGSSEEDAGGGAPGVSSGDPRVPTKTGVSWGTKNFRGHSYTRSASVEAYALRGDPPGLNGNPEVSDARFAKHYGQDKQLRNSPSCAIAQRWGFWVKTEKVTGSPLSVGFASHASDMQIEVALRISGDPSRVRGDPD